MVLALGVAGCVPGDDASLADLSLGQTDATVASSPGDGRSTPPSTDAAEDPSNDASNEGATNDGAAAVEAVSDLRIVAMGDSLTEGNGDDSGVGYPGRLLERVQGSNPDATIVNLGRSGWTSEQLINGAYGEPSQLDAGIAVAPTVACVWIGNNDLWYLYSGGAVSGNAEAENLATFTQNMDTIISRLTATGARVYVGLNDDQSRRPVSVKREMFPDMGDAALAQMSAQVTRYNDATTAIAGRYGATVVDFYRTTIFVTPATLSDDDVHPNAAGYDEVARIWFAAIEPALR